MGITTMTSREFNQDASKAKRASLHGPVFITDRGKAAHVLLTIKEFKKLTRKDKNIAELLSMPKSTRIDFHPPKLSSKLYKPADFL